MLCALMALMLLLPAAGGAEILNLPLDFEPAPKPQGVYPAPYSDPAWWHYEDPSITADYEMVTSKEWKVTYYAVRVKIANGSQLRTAAANSFDKKGVAPIQTISRRMNAVAAINGDFYSGNAGRYVLRQGQVFRDHMNAGQDLLLIDEDGDFHIVLADEHPEEMDKTVIGGKRVNNAICFGPALIRDGEIVVDVSRAQDQSHPIALEHRAAICQTGPLEYMIITVWHWGFTLEGFADFLASFEDVKQAYNLDGGMSARIVFMGELRNKSSEGQRSLPDIIYFASAYRPDEAE